MPGEVHDERKDHKEAQRTDQERIVLDSKQKINRTRTRGERIRAGTRGGVCLDNITDRMESVSRDSGSEPWTLATNKCETRHPEGE